MKTKHDGTARRSPPRSSTGGPLHVALAMDDGMDDASRRLLRRMDRFLDEPDAHPDRGRLAGAAWAYDAARRSGRRVRWDEDTSSRRQRRTALAVDEVASLEAGREQPRRPEVTDEALAGAGRALLDMLRAGSPAAVVILVALDEGAPRSAAG